MINKNLKTVKIIPAAGEPLVHHLNSERNGVNYRDIIAGGIIIILGVISGYFMATRRGLQGVTGTSRTGGPESSTIVGSKDSKTFRDNAEGKLVSGGINGEGTHKLERPGGESQTVALTSSVLDLSQFEGKKVRVWGETFAAQSAGWLMDVGKVEVME